MAKKKNAISNTSTPIREKTNNSATIERLRNVDFNNEYSWRERPVSPAFLEKMARELEDWAIDEKDNHRPYSLKNFTRPRRLRKSILDEWAKKNEVFRAAYEFVKEALGSRRYDLRVEHRFDEKAFFLNQRRYDDEFEEDFKIYNEAIKASLPKQDNTDKKVVVEVVHI